MNAAGRILAFGIGLVSATTGLTFPCQAGLFRLESETLTSARNGDDLKFELPSYEFLSATYVSTLRDFEVNSDLNVYADPVKSHDTLNVHLLNLSYSPVHDVLNITAGRVFDIQRSVRSSVLDTAAIDLFLFEKQIKIGTFAGKERHLELAQWTPSATLLGAYASYMGASMFPLYTKAKYQHRIFERDLNSQEDLIQVSAQKPFPGGWSPEYLADTEINLGTSHLNRLSAGINLYPTYRTSLRWRAETYELQPIDGVEQPIFSIFSQGRLYETSVQAEYRFSPHFSTSFSLAYDNYVNQSPDRTDGIKAEADFRYRRNHSSVSNSFYALQSYGGQVYGDRLVLTQKLTDLLELAEAVDFAFYNKVTSSKRAAFSSQLELTQSLSNRLRLTLGGEMNSNNSVTYDARAFAALKYLMWTEI
ncbi:hypothetical protein WDW37_10715 [Bdellovibrionota bacterium FG-1]